MAGRAYACVDMTVSIYIYVFKVVCQDADYIATATTYLWIL